jgi:hypothetical protein
MPPRAPIVTPFISNLITSKDYPSLPTADELQSVHSILSAKSAALALELQQAHQAEQAAAAAHTANSSQTKKKDKDKDKEKDKDGGGANTKKRKLATEEGSEALALAANAASGAKLEALERQRAIDRLANGGKLASPGGVKVKRERMSGESDTRSCVWVRPSAHGSFTGPEQCVECWPEAASRPHYVRAKSADEKEEEESYTRQRRRAV